MFNISPMLTARVKRVVKSSPLLTRIVVPLYSAKSIVLSNIPAKGNFPLFPERAHLETFDFQSLAEFESWKIANGELFSSWEVEDDAVLSVDRFAFRVPGFCALCDESVNFVATTAWSATDATGRIRVNWREHLICPQCNQRNRVRAALHFAMETCGMAADKRIYLTEQFGSTYRWMRGRFKYVSGSEYFSPRYAAGSRLLGITHQDVQHLSFAPGSFDYVLTFEVLEHVPDYLAAFASLAQVLRPGGRLVMTVPFTIDKHATTVRAALGSDGQVEHYLQPEFHGNPTDPLNGALCFRYFGWDVLERLVDAGFAEATLHVYHDGELGYRGGAQTLISAIKA